VGQAGLLAWKVYLGGCNRLLDRSIFQPEIYKLQKRYRKYRQHLFAFL
jgi:hypothetical protein